MVHVSLLAVAVLIGVPLAEPLGEVEKADALATIGFVAVIAAAGSYALGGNLSRRCPMHPDWLTTRALGFASLILGIILACRSFTKADLVFSTDTNSLSQWLAIAYLGIVPTAWCSILRYRQIVAHGYTFVSYTGYMVPVMSIVLGHVFFSESPPWELGLGLMCILGGLALSRRRVTQAVGPSVPTESHRADLRAPK